MTRQPADAKAVSSYYLERAIAPQSGREQLDDARVVRIDPLRLTSQDLESSDLLLFDHPGKLSEDLLRQTSNLLQRGRGLLYVAAEPIDATNLMLLSKAAAGNLKLPVAFQPPPSGQPRSNLSLVDMRLRDPPFSVFGEEAPALFSAVRFHGGLATRRVKGTLIDDVLATYNDQSACLVATPCGAGLLVVLNTDLAQSTLAASPAFVPLIGELTSQLLGRDAAREAFASGEPIAVYLPPSASPVMGLVVEPQSGRALEPDVAGELREEAVGVLWQAPRAGPPGAYEIKRNGTPVFAATTAIPAEEADLSSLPADLLTDRLGGGRDVKYRSALRRDDPRDTGWVWLAIGCLTCLFGELIGLRLFRS
ncbi:MAG: hypothetical protein EHM42_10320 [Planctomycetaceae bacterium]|nr:MAG: hypothetical protein EHM42_10320 [Planctomycetaceae bacterium]